MGAHQLGPGHKGDAVHRAQVHSLRDSILIVCPLRLDPRPAMLGLLRGEGCHQRAQLMLQCGGSARSWKVSRRGPAARSVRRTIWRLAGQMETHWEQPMQAVSSMKMAMSRSPPCQLLTGCPSKLSLCCLCCSNSASYAALHAGGCSSAGP